LDSRTDPRAPPRKGDANRPGPEQKGQNMKELRRYSSVVALLAVLMLVAAACSSGGGKQEEQQAATGGGGQAANTPRIKVAMVTHAVAGDTFWDIIQKGANAAAAKDNVQFLYSNDPDAGRQAQLVQAAIDQKVDGIAVTLAKPDALKDVVTKAIQAGIPVVSLNAGENESPQYGLLGHFGQNESLAGEAAGEALNKLGAKKAICVLQEQGHVGLEARCAGAKKTFSGSMQNLFAQGANLPQFQSTITSKLQADKSIDAVLTLGAPFALAATQSVKEAGSSAKVATFDMNKDLVKALADGQVEFAVDQQPYLQGYLSVDSLWLYKTNGNILGGGKPVLTGPAVVTKDQGDAIAAFADRGTR
jgi:ABC-type sugar transport system substrate-binding protein